jgi:hypothetical protein
VFQAAGKTTAGAEAYRERKTFAIGMNAWIVVNAHKSDGGLAVLLVGCGAILNA